MKRRIEKPSESAMRFFTPELYVQFNSADDGEADRADEAWEEAIRRYHDHLATIRDRMPSQVRKLADLCLHDAELLSIQEDMQSYFPAPANGTAESTWSAVAILSLKQDATIYSVIYVLWDRVRTQPAPRNWRLSRATREWLYDEVDVAVDRKNAFVHRILLSDGEVLEIPFLAAFISRVSVAANGKAKRVKRSA